MITAPHGRIEAAIITASGITFFSQGEEIVPVVMKGKLPKSRKFSKDKIAHPNRHLANRD